jgi:electron transport complex protein RnfG
MFIAVLVTCAVSATALTFAYGATRDLIEEQERIAREQALREVLVDAAELEELDEDALACLDEAAEETPVDGVFIGKEENGQVVGVGVLVAPRGYGGPVRMAVGLDRDGKVAGVRVISHSETPGLGSKIVTEEPFLAQFEGWSAEEVESSDQGFDAISGATKSSAGARKGVQAAERVYLAWPECVGGGLSE